MKIFEGKSPEERNKIIAAIVLGALAVLAIGYNGIGFFPSGKKAVTVSGSPTASPTASRTGDTVVTALPQQNEIDNIYASIPVAYAASPGAPDPGRNIFAFYEPPVPTPWSPTPPPPIKTPEPKTPEPIVYDIAVNYISRQSVYAGEKGFRLEVGGEKFAPDTYIYFNGSQLPTNFIGPQQLSADIPANFIASEGQRQIVVQTTDGKRFSAPVVFNVQAPPRPQFQYLGIVSRKRGNNDTAYIQEQAGNNAPPVSKRLNDIVGGRFRLVSIAPTRLMVQDVNLGFMHTVELVKGSGGQFSSSTTGPNHRLPSNNIYQPNYPTIPNQPIPNQPCPPGIPCDKIKPYESPTPNPQKQDADDDEDGDN